MELIIFICGMLVGWNMRGDYQPNVQVNKVEEYVIPKWTQADEDAFNKRNGIDPNILDIRISTGAIK